MTTDDDATRARLLAAYDEQLRTDAETPSAVSVERLGPLRLVTFASGRGFITYQSLGDLGEPEIAALVPEAFAHYTADETITSVEWKTRGHDRAPGLHEALLANGFRPDDPESIMIGDAQDLIADVPLPPGVALCRVTDAAGVRAMCAMEAGVFGDTAEDAAGMEAATLARFARDPDMELWVALAGDTVVCAGRLEPVPGTSFAGIWGGATLPEWRRKGIYRALTAARARSAVALGKTLIHSDSTEFSRPILERSGLLKVSTTTPYVWKRG
ncbi:GNAT family N-acetyltransferase [Frondihabitans australicus]|uniref:N-acetyltransferase domain-containing protein n=1 Tax=Frondihabitans australicus TaxID=386892 RepID=A0A495IDD8_9MICO|nr:GNAT family N-acetyltransferase [Frondihabitans australicus]RKR73982.1 hypothetical protein C8E83_1083 [Frondihabitans australicus]